MSFRFDLVPVSGHFEFGDDAWRKTRFHLMEFQPVSDVRLVGEPPSRIRVVSQGDSTEVAPALLARVEELAGTTFRVEPAE